MNRARIIAAASAAVVVAGGIGVAAALSRPATEPFTSSSISSSAPAPTPTPDSANTPTASPKATDPLTGGKVSNHEVIAVKVENIAAARPQVGLSQADITFVEEVEGAQTRLIAVYHSRFPKRLGPVRSARSTDVQLLPLFGKPGLVYSGANSAVQRKIDNASIVPIPRSTRDHRRVAPHNVFVDLAAIAQSTKLAQGHSNRLDLQRECTAWCRGKRGQGARRARHVQLQIYLGSIHRALEWIWYADGDNGAITKTDNVVIMKVHNHPDGNRDVLGAPSVQSDTVGTGTVIDLPRRKEDRRPAGSERKHLRRSASPTSRESRSHSSRVRPGLRLPASDG